MQCQHNPMLGRLSWQNAGTACFSSSSPINASWRMALTLPALPCPPGQGAHQQGRHAVLRLPGGPAAAGQPLWQRAAVGREGRAGAGPGQGEQWAGRLQPCARYTQETHWPYLVWWTLNDHLQPHTLDTVHHLQLSPDAPRCTLRRACTSRSQAAPAAALPPHHRPHPASQPHQQRPSHPASCQP